MSSTTLSPPYIWFCHFEGHKEFWYHLVDGLVGGDVDVVDVVKEGTEGEGRYFDEGMCGNVVDVGVLYLGEGHAVLTRYIGLPTSGSLSSDCSSSK